MAGEIRAAVLQIVTDALLLIAVLFLDEPAFCLKPPLQRPAGQSLQQIDRRHGNFGRLHKFENAIRCVVRVRSQTQAGPRGYLDPTTIQDLEGRRPGRLIVALFGHGLQRAGPGVSIPQ